MSFFSELHIAEQNRLNELEKCFFCGLKHSEGECKYSEPEISSNNN